MNPNSNIEKRLNNIFDNKLEIIQISETIHDLIKSNK